MSQTLLVSFLSSYISSFPSILSFVSLFHAGYTCAGSVDIEVDLRAQALTFFFNSTLHGFKYH